MQMAALGYPDEVCLIPEEDGGVLVDRQMWDGNTSYV